ncbi:MAG: thymidine phosphorylase [Cycloclasticus sp.]|nr:MAG: thymidine phosphorylase [Cycloclasticus sp.]
MKNVESKFNFKGQQGTKSSLSVFSIEKEKILQSAINVLTANLQEFLAVQGEKVEQSFFDAADLGSMEASSLKFEKIEARTDDLKLFKKVNKYLPSIYIDSVVKNLKNFSQEKIIGGEAQSSDEDWSTLELLAADEMDTQLLIDSCISNAESNLSKILYSVQRRIEFLFDSNELKASKNPVGPAVLMNAYVELIKEEPFSKEASIHLYATFEQEVLGKLAHALEEINTLFIKANILPKLKKQKIKKTETVDKRQFNLGNVPGAGGGNQFPAANSSIQSGQKSGKSAPSIEPVIYSSLVQMAQTYRVQSKEELINDGLAVSGAKFPTIELIHTLTDIQKEGSVGGVDIKESVRSQIGSKIQVDGHRQPYTEQDEVLIDVIAMFFDLILKDKHLPDAVRAMIAQLQIPILKVVMIDKEFFAKKAHPARKFLNSLSHAGLGVSEKNMRIKHAVFEKMEEVVERVLIDFDDDVEIFAELHEEFEVFMSQQQHQIELIEERSRKESKSAEQLELTKRQASYEVALRLQGKSLPEFIRLFLDDAWKDVLVLALLRRERAPEEMHQCVSVLERLIKSTTPFTNDEERMDVIIDLTDLRDEIKEGLESISYDYHESAPFLKELESWHNHNLGIDAGEKVGHADDVALVNIDANICAATLEEDLLKELEGELSQMPDDKYSVMANKMKMGDWVEYTNMEGLVVRAKLTWKSSVTSQCLFVNDRGVKALDINIARLADDFRENKMGLVGQEKAPLVERILFGMKRLMKPKNTEVCIP